MKDQRYPFALDIGTEIGGYRIETVLGAGGFGITYRAYNEITRKSVAIKEFYVRDISTREGQTVVVDTEVDEGTYEYALRKFQEEAQAVVTRFAHPYIIRGENFLRQHNTCYMIMEYVDGRNLDDWLQQRKIPPVEAEIRPLFEKLFEAVDYVHSHNTMHRDLTPRNIMVRPNGDPVLIDFGAAGLGIDLGRSSKIVAQLRYAPPEQTDDTGGGIHGRYTDVFSLGGVLFRTVTGKTPMAPMTRLTRMGAHRGDAVDPQRPVAELVADPNGYSPRFLAGIDAALQLDERRRPQSIGELRQALGWAPGDAVTIRTTPPDPVRLPPADEVTQIYVPTPERTHTASPHPEPANRFVTPNPAQASTIATPQPAAPPRKRGGAVAAVLAILLLGGGVGTWLAWPQVTSLIDQVSGPAVVTPFTFAATSDGRSLTFSGYVLTDEARKAIAEAAAKAAPGLSVTNRLRLAKGGRPEHDELARDLVGTLGGFAQVTLAISDGDARIDGAAATPDVYPGLRQTLTERLNRAGKGSLHLDPATVQPYAFAIAVAPGTVTMSGYLPSQEGRDALRKALAGALPAARLDDRTQIALGAPFDLVAAVTPLVPRLALLGEGRLSADDAGLRLQGTPRAPALFEQASAEPTGLPAGVKVVLNLSLPVMAPYQWSITSDGQTVVARGYVPSVEARQGLAAAVAASAPGLPFKDETQLAAGAPAEFQQLIALLAGQLGAFQRGRLSLTGDTVSVEGLPKVVGDTAPIETALRNGLPAGLKLGAARFEALKVSPYIFAAEVEDGVIRLTGYVPNDQLRRDAETPAAGARLVNNLQIAEGAPAGLPEAVRFAVDHARRLSSGKISLRDTHVAVDGVVRSLEDLAALNAEAKSGLPGGIILDPPKYRTRTDLPAGACDQLALPAEVADKPAGVTGIDFVAIDAAKAVPACRDAVAEAPNVRRLATAYGVALQKNRQLAEAIRQFRLAVEAGDPVAMLHLGQLARDGSGMPQDAAVAFDLFTKAAQAGSRGAFYALGEIYEAGQGRPRDLAKAAEWYQKAANADYGPAWSKLGMFAENGTIRGIPDYPRAAEAYERGARLGSSQAMYQLGLLYQSGMITNRQPDYAKAFDWFSRAADAGRPESMAALGTLYLDGLGREVDAVKASQWLEKAAAAGDSSAYLQLGRIAFEGLGRPRDLAAAQGWWEKAAAAGRTQAYSRLGLLFQTGVGTPPKPDYAQAYDWDLKGTKINDPQSYFQLGQLYEGGLGRPVDNAKAAEAYQRAGDLGHSPSLYQLGVRSESGRGMPVDFARAVGYYKRAADLGHAPSMVQLGLLTQTGSGTAKDDTAALLWFTKALQAGNANALWYASVLTDAGRGGARNPDRVATYLLKALAQHEPHAIEAFNGDLAAFTPETRVALQKQLLARGLLQKPAADGIYDAETRRAALAVAAPTN